MKAHELAKLLLAGPDLPVTISDDCGSFEVDSAEQTVEQFNGVEDTEDTPREADGWISERPCVTLTPEAFAFRYAQIQPLTPDMLAKMGEAEGLLAKKLKP